MHSYPTFTSDFIDWELDGAQGWAYYNWARENEVRFWGGGVKNVSPAYVKQEWLKLMDEWRKANVRRE